MPRVRFKPLTISKRRWRQTWFSSSDPNDAYTPISHDPEKADSDWEDASHASSASSSRVSSASYESHQSHEHLLDHRRPRKPASAYQPRKTFNIYFTLILGTILVVFVLALWGMQQRSAAEVRSGVHKQEQTKPPWEDFSKLERYYGGLRSLVNEEDNVPEWPAGIEEVVEELKEAAANDLENRNAPVIEPRSSGLAQFPKGSKPPVGVTEETAECFLDDERNTRVPELHRHDGVIRGLPHSAVAMNLLSDSNKTQCLDRYGRYGSYGFGYSQKFGGIGAGLEGLGDGAEDVWRHQPRINYSNVNWGQAQNACVLMNNHRFPPTSDDSSKMSSSGSPLTKTAILVRTTSDHIFSPDEILHLRSLISEASLSTGGLYTVHILVHAPDEVDQSLNSPSIHEEFLASFLPAEFRNLGVLWTSQQMRLTYPGLTEEGFYDTDRGVYLPIQHFTHKHPEYEQFWIWDMDSRSTGHVGDLLQGINAWSRQQPRKEIWERSARFYVPSEHGSWDKFSQMIHVLAEHAPTDPFTDVKDVSRPVWGPLSLFGDSVDPSLLVQPATSQSSDAYTWGVGEPADLVSLSPIFDPSHVTGLPKASDMTGYNATDSLPPRRATTSHILRLSRRLLLAMHAETAQRNRYMGPELWPASVALHYGFKAVYAPHETYVDRKWPTDYLAAVVNTGADGGAVSGRNSVWNEARRGIFDGLSFGSNPSAKAFSRKLYRRWLGYRDEETGEGGEEWEEEGEGRMCLPPMLLGGVGNVELVIDE